MIHSRRFGPALALALVIPALAGGSASEAAAQGRAPQGASNPSDVPVRVASGQVFQRLDPNRPPALGPESAKVVVLVFSDFQCPVCRRTAEATQQIADEFPGEVRTEFWQKALVSHANAENAAVASLAAHRQGKFWEYHDELFANQRALDAASLAGYAGGLGLDLEQFRRDYEDPALRARVQQEGVAAESFGARSTPSFMINGKLHVGWGSWASFRGNVEREVLAARKLEAEGTPLEHVAASRAKASMTDPDQYRLYADLLAPPPQAAAPDGTPEKPGKKAKKKKRSAEK